ncbi:MULTISPECIES: WS/DGAT domain-containing protein [Streptomyces]|uniref:WS/DGAT domain-containing protein n=1 Tax=Streptomyces TaxID=1883 RepID=UPI00163CEB55|nr:MULTISPECIES: WS/DGAT domain-containing protein [Streptomyces]MBC2879136.1 DUF1298 domain-containing protein [Streptomyces sp. TYQ1024]UBI35337.1 WSD1 family O-acyltransferase [Streptomyces mobaraensis]UKW27928.1 WSD1 family O-acyltransferase [Streptomyces sp. TYQ1024]
MPEPPVPEATAAAGPRPGRDDFWARAWSAYERRYPADPLVMAQAFLCAGLPPSRAELREMVRLAARLMPALAPAEAETTAVLDRHVFETEAGRGSGERGLRAVLGRLAVAPLPDTGADLWLVTGYAPGAFALVPRVRHGLLDGVGGSAVTALIVRALAGSGHSPRPEPAPLAGAGRRTASGWGVCRAALLLADVAVGVPPAARLAVVRERGPDEPLLHHWAFLRTALLRPVMSAFGAGPNDVVLACLAGALGARDGGGRVPRTVTALVPVTLRADAHGPEDGNRFVGARVRLPAGEPDPVRRLCAVAARMRTVRRVAARPETERLLRWCPDAVAAWTLRRGLRPWGSSLLATHVPGPQGRIRLPGWRVDHVVPLTFLPAGHPLAVAVMDYGGEFCVAFTARAGYGGVDGLPRRLAEAVRELCAAAGPGDGR